MASGQSSWPVIAAITSAAVLAVAKFVAAAFSGGAAMLTEGVVRTLAAR